MRRGENNASPTLCILSEVLVLSWLLSMTVEMNLGKLPRFFLVSDV
jgi:hypothetical protein